MKIRIFLSIVIISAMALFAHLVYAVSANAAPFAWVTSVFDWLGGLSQIQWDIKTIILSLGFLAVGTFVLGALWGAYIVVWKEPGGKWPKRFFNTLMATAFTLLALLVFLRLDGILGVLTYFELWRSDATTHLAAVGQDKAAPTNLVGYLQSFDKIIIVKFLIAMLIIGLVMSWATKKKG